MARAYQQSQPNDYDRDQGPGEWQSLRNELVALLDQVDGQVARRDGSLSERVRDLRHQVTEADHNSSMRHRDALRSVQRQISRFEEPAQMPPNPRDSLQAAISQIRASQGGARQQNYAPASPAPQAQRGSDAPMLERLAHSVNSLSGRLEGLEGEIRAQVKTGANVKDVADQVAQLAHVVELLAGAVGETGQVKRLEGQIASLGKIMSQGREMDISTLMRRLDDVASTVGKLAELQVHFTEKVQNPVEMDAFKDGMRSIEDSVRNVYDRIDALERQRSLTPQDLEIVTSEMARFTAALQEHNQPNNLVELVDALNSRISDIESGDKMLHSLRKDLSALRDAVVVSLTPRFDSIDDRLTTLSAEVGTRADMAEIGRQIGELSDRMGDRGSDPGISQIEAQVRQLVARMDQTGEQLTGLAKLYSEPAPVAMPEIDFDAMADIVATRAAAAMSKHTPDATLSTSIGSLEQRITSMLAEMRQDETPIGDFGGMQAGINEVNDRLKRLEASLMNRAASADAVPASNIAAIIAEAEAAVPMARPRDAMPRNPVVDAPLIAPAFPDPQPMAEDRLAARKRHPGLDADVPLAARHDKPAPPSPSAGFEPPPAPTPTSGFFEPAAAPAVDTKPEPVTVTPEARASTNTFIEAARRMSQRQSAPVPAAPASNSLIGRALSRFQTGEKPAAPAPTVADKIEKAGKPAKVKVPRAARALAGDKPARTAYVPDADAAVASLEPQIKDEAPKPKVAGEPSFLAKNRRTLLLAALVVAVGLLAANLVMQRMLEPSAPAEPAPITTGDIADEELLPMDATPMDETPVAAAKTPRVIDMTDPVATGAIDQSATQAFTTGPLQAMPQAFTAASDLAKGGDIAPLAPVSPVAVELPPEGVGPQDLREAAASGDARAQFEVAAILTEGRALPQDYAGAAIWYERAAASGFVPAQYRLGSLYENGNGVDKDLEKAKLWYERAAEAGNRMAMHNLAALYAGGAMGKQEFNLAAKWFEEAASRGMTDSQFNLGMLYARGLGVPQSLEDSFKWFGIAAGSGDADAGKARDDIARSLDAETMTRLTDIVNNFVPRPIDLAANFAPIGTWSKSFDPGENISARDIVASVQKALGKLGYDVGTPDGIAGAKTQTAIKQFELATGMTEIGQINPRLLAVLGSQPV
jgi:localization factor PodJL